MSYNKKPKFNYNKKKNKKEFNKTSNKKHERNNIPLKSAGGGGVRW